MLTKVLLVCRCTRSEPCVQLNFCHVHGWFEAHWLILGVLLPHEHILCATSGQSFQQIKLYCETFCITINTRDCILKLFYSFTQVLEGTSQYATDCETITLELSLSCSLYRCVFSLFFQIKHLSNQPLTEVPTLLMRKS